MDGRARAAKTLSWKAICTSVTAVLVLLFTGKIGLSLEIGAAEFLITSALYYLHEILWEKAK